MEPNDYARPFSAGVELHFKQAIPILRIFDRAKAHEFYLGFLGFSQDWEHSFGENFPAYFQISRAGLVLHLSEHHGDATPGSAAFIWMTGLDGFHSELTAKSYTYAKPGIERWGGDAADASGASDMRVMEIIDPFGNRLRFAERSVQDSG